MKNSTMKNKIMLLILAGGLFLSLFSYAGGYSTKNANAMGGDLFSARSIIMNIGFGIPTYQTPYNNNFTLPKTSLALEFGIHKWISLGGFVAINYWSSNGQDKNFTYLQTQPDFLIGAKGSFHFSAIGNEKWNWNLNTERVDIYASAFVGVGTYMWNQQITDRNTGVVTTSSGSNTYPVVGASAGIRYLFTPRFGVYAEAGFSPLGNINGGFTFKLR
jgi:hypothetical protein